MLRKGLILAIAVSALTVVAFAASNDDGALVGVVVDEAGQPVRGATVSAFDDVNDKSVSVYSNESGKFRIVGLDARQYTLRARLLGMEDTALDADLTDGVAEHKLVMAKATDLNPQRPANSRLDLLHWEDESDALNFRMMCTYCHQVGTEGFRSPEEPVDWEVMVTRMDGFRGLYQHTQDALVDKLLETYGVGAEDSWASYEVPERPSGEALQAEVTVWELGKENEAMIHDLEVGKDGRVYTVDMLADAISILDPATGERKHVSFPGGKDYDTTDAPIKGPHSIEVAPNGDMWVTLALSGEMAKYVPSTGEFVIIPGQEAPRKRGGYPHTLRVNQDGSKVWWTDAGMGVLSVDTASYEVKFYELPSADQVQGGGARGESRGLTPYGIDVGPDGKVWYTKLNGQRVGRVDDTKPDGHPDQIKEWEPPVHGPRRLHVAADNRVWVPGWASGDIASYHEATDVWKVYKLPHGDNSLPYALNIHPETGEIWITGTGSDSMIRFDPESEKFTEFRMPTRVTYTREIEFDEDGNIWTANSNYPTRHIEHRRGSVIKIALADL